MGAASPSANTFAASAHTATTGFWCGTLGFITVPLGFCEEPEEETITPEPEPAPEPAEPEPAPPPEAPTPQPTSTPEPQIIRETPTYVTEHITNEYITNPTTIIRETIERGGGSGNNIDTSNFVTRSLFDAQVNGTLNSIDNSVDGLSDNLSEEVSTNLLTVIGNGTISGTLDVTGALTAATSTLAALTVTNGTTLSGSLTLAALGGGILQTNSAGLVSTTSIGAASVTNDSLDFSEFVDAFTLDATATFDLDTNGADWNIDSNTFFVDSSANRVGIGTSTPSYNLTVAGDMWLGGALYDSVNKSAGVDGYILQTTGSGTEWIATSTLGITSSFLGLTDTPNSYTANRLPFTNSAGDALTDSAELTFNGDRMFVVPNGGQSDGLVAANAFVGHHSAGSTFAVFSHKDSQNNTEYALRHSLAGQTNLNAADGSFGGIFFSINGTNEAVLDVDGDFGIGTTTPSRKLSVAQSADANGLSITGFDDQSGSNGHLSIDGGGTFNIDASGVGQLLGNGTAVAAWNSSTFVMADDKELAFGDNSDYSWGYNQSDDSLRLVDGSNVGTDANARLTVLSSGNVGIGTDIPDYKLDVSIDTNGSDTALILNNTDSGLANGQELRLDFEDKTRIANYYESGDGSTGFKFYTSANSSVLNADPTLTLQGSGNLGIGTTTPTSKLSIQTTGTTDIFNLFETDGEEVFTVLENGRVGIGTTSPVSKLSVTGTMSVDGLTGSTGAGSLCLTSNNEVVFNSGSDACLPSLRESKHDIETLDVAALDMVTALESVSFKYNMGDGRTRYGFIAEDVADIDALLATYDAEGNISGIDDRSMIAVVVQGMQEMWVKVQSLLSWRDEADEEIEMLQNELCAKDDSYSWCDEEVDSAQNNDNANDESDDDSTVTKDDTDGDSSDNSDSDEPDEVSEEDTESEEGGGEESDEDEGSSGDSGVEDETESENTEASEDTETTNESEEGSDADETEENTEEAPGGELEADSDTSDESQGDSAPNGEDESDQSDTAATEEETTDTDKSEDNDTESDSAETSASESGEASDVVNADENDSESDSGSADETAGE